MLNIHWEDCSAINKLTLCYILMHALRPPRYEIKLLWFTELFIGLEATNYRTTDQPGNFPWLLCV